MNEVISRAMELNTEVEWEVELPILEIGDVVELREVWDGEGDDPTILGSYSYQLTEGDWINYCWEVVKQNEDALFSLVKITKIELL